MTDTASIATKKCSHCKEDKLFSEFNVKDKAAGKLQSRCKPCQALVSRAHYLANKQKIIDRSAINAAERRVKLEKVVEARLANEHCAECGATEHLTFHVNRDYDGPRVSAILNSGMALEALLDSIAHSTVLCKTCEAKSNYQGLAAYQEARRAGGEYAPKGISKNEYKARYTKSNKDRRRKNHAA